MKKPDKMRKRPFLKYFYLTTFWVSIEFNLDLNVEVIFYLTQWPGPYTSKTQAIVLCTFFKNLLQQKC